MEKKLQKIYLTYYSLFILQDSWQVHYQILTIIFLKEFIKLNIKTFTMIKYVKVVELHTIYVTIFLITKISRMI